MNHYYLIIGTLTYKKITSGTLENAYNLALEQFDYENTKIVSKTNSSIFFNAVYNGIPYRCSVTHETALNVDELEDEVIPLF